jgi:proton-translocating NADH-quinone oxidoreductase chain L
MEIIQIFLPFISSLIIFSFGRHIGINGVKIFSISNMLITFLLSIILVHKIILKKTIINLKLFSWFTIGSLVVDWGFLFDNLSVLMIFTVSLVSTLVHLYACYYMETDPHLVRFMGYLSLFTFFMLFLITADNFLQLFIGWEGVGLCSYLLINFWFTRIQANKAAMKAIILNRVGDCALLLAIALILFLFKTVDFLSIFPLSIYFSNENFSLFSFNINFINLICLLLFIGAMGKSAQIGLHTWLPDAMEGPTPVSALIHAATMVTAGVYLIIRCSALFECCPSLLKVITIIGALTAFLGASSAILQNDIKKIIAYSTCSQLGYMVMACGISQYAAAIFHLVNHAFFKALLFLGAGIIIHSLNGEQDMRKMGGLFKLLPLTYITMLIASFALAGLPFLAGFYSKEAILGCLYSDNQFYSTFSYWIGLISALLTSLYSAKILFLVFFSSPRGFRLTYLNAHKTSWLALTPLFVLSFFSMCSGFLLKDALIGLGTNFFDGIIFTYSKNVKIGDSEFLPLFFKVFPIFISLFGFLIFSLKLYSDINLHFFEFLSKQNFYYYQNFKKIVNSLIRFFSNKWYFDLIYNEFLVQNVFVWSYNVGYKLIDKGLLELLGVKFMWKINLFFSNLVMFSQNGFISTYIRLILLSLCFIQILYLF